MSARGRSRSTDARVPPPLRKPDEHEMSDDGTSGQHGSGARSSAENQGPSSGVLSPVSVFVAPDLDATLDPVIRIQGLESSLAKHSRGASRWIGRSEHVLATHEAAIQHCGSQVQRLVQDIQSLRDVLQKREEPCQADWNAKVQAELTQMKEEVRSEVAQIKKVVDSLHQKESSDVAGLARHVEGRIGKPEKCGVNGIARRGRLDG